MDLKINTESEILKKIQIAASNLKSRLFRNNVGTGWTGQRFQQLPGKLILLNPRPLRAGLCTGSSDLIGWTPLQITQEMVGSTLAVFTAVEVKRLGKDPTEEQEDFLNAVHNAGGIALCCHSTEELDRGLSEYKRKFCSIKREDSF
jgi:hypothetical protein